MKKLSPSRSFVSAPASAKASVGRQDRLGFTLIELLLVIGIIAILAAIVIVAINPTRQLGQARNAERSSEVTTILNAYWQYAIDNGGLFHPAITTAACKVGATVTPVCKSATADGTGVGQCGETGILCIHSAHLVPTYIVAVPSDPQDKEVTPLELKSVDYTIVLGGTNRLTVAALYPELGATISVSR